MAPNGRHRGVHVPPQPPLPRFDRGGGVGGARAVEGPVHDEARPARLRRHDGGLSRANPHKHVIHRNTSEFHANYALSNILHDVYNSEFHEKTQTQTVR